MYTGEFSSEEREYEGEMYTGEFTAKKISKVYFSGVDFDKRKIQLPDLLFPVVLY